MAYDVLTIDQLTEYVVSVHSNRLPEFRIERSSPTYKRLRSHVLGVADTHAHLDAIVAAIDPTRAERADLTALAAVWKVFRKGATAARQTDAGRVRGTNGTVLATTDTLVHAATGTRYALGEAGVIPASGFLDVDIIAITLGTAGRRAKGDVLVFESTPAGAVSEVELQKALDVDGQEEESDNALRDRLLYAIAFPAEAGAVSDWERWARAIAGVDKVFVLPHRQFDYAVDLVAFHAGSGAARFFSAPERAALLAALQAFAPGSAQVRVIESVSDSQAIKVSVSPTEARFARDWTDTPTPPTVLTYTAGTRALQFAGGSRPPDMLPGKRLVWEGVSGELVEIESLSGADTVILKTNPATPPVATQAIYSGGPLTQPVIDAIRAYLDTLGPARGDFGVGWDDTVRVSHLNGAANTVEGVLDASTIAPAAGYTPLDFGYPSDAQIPAVVPLYIHVRYQ